LLPSQDYKGQSSKHKVLAQMKMLLLIAGILLATVGGVITYRALYVEPRSAVVITDTDVRELPNYARVVGGALLFVGGTALALFAATRKVKS
jgi:hypothetical protein